MKPTEQITLEEYRHDEVSTDPDHPLIMDIHGALGDPFGIVYFICSSLITVVLIILSFVE